MRLAPVAPLLDNLTIALVRVDMRRVDPAKAEKLALLVGLSATAGFDVADLRHDLEIMVKSFLESGGEDLFFVATLADISSSPPFVAIPIRNGAKPERLLKWLEQTDRVVRQQQGNVVIGSSQAVADRLKSLQPFRHRAIEEAFAIPEDSPVQVIVSLPVEVRPFLTQLYPKLPRRDWRRLDTGDRRQRGMGVLGFHALARARPAIDDQEQVGSRRQRTRSNPAADQRPDRRTPCRKAIPVRLRETLRAVCNRKWTATGS